jgi:DNA-binding LytR/AlgR family response regulator
VNSSVLQSALREWTRLGRSPRLWATFAIVVSIFVAIGPSGTIEDMGLVERAAFWTLLHGAAWTVAILVITLADHWLAQHLRSQALLLAATALVAAPFVAAVVELMRWSWAGTEPSLASYGRQLLVCLPLSVLFSLLSHLTMSNAPSASVSSRASEDPEPKPTEVEPPPLLARLKPALRAPLVHLTVEDHYTVVTTTKGRQLVLMRFSDALREVGSIPGVQTHRSHWVAVDHVAGLKSSGSRLHVVLKSGAEVPVSRSFAAHVRDCLGEN